MAKKKRRSGGRSTLPKSMKVERNAFGAIPSRAGTKVERISLRVLLILVVVAVLAGFFARVAIGRKAGRDLIKAEKLCSEGKLQEAFIIIDRIWANYPRFRKRAVSYYRGLCLMDAGETDEAVTMWKNVMELKPDRKYYPASWYQLTHLLELRGEFEEAVKDYEKILSEFKDSIILPEVKFGLANCYVKLERWKDAKAKYDEILSGFDEDNIIKRAKKELGNLNVGLILSPHITEDSIKYEVKSGDTLEKIANTHNTTVSLIKKANGLKSDVIQIGKILKVTPNRFEIQIDAVKNTLILKSQGKFFKEYPIGTGVHETTPIGSFKIVNKQVEPVWYSEKGVFAYGHPENILGTRWMGIDRTGYGIHGTTKPETIGEHSSRGCIRLYNQDVEELFILVTVDTPVQITGKKAPQGQVF